MNAIYATGSRVIESLNRMLASKLAAREPVTWQFRGFCRDEGLSLSGGVFHPRRPWPFALREPLVCSRCGWVEEAGHLHSAENYVKTYSGGYGPDAEPDEWALMCPECSELDSYEPQVACDCCGEYPCICQSDDDGLKGGAGAGEATGE